MNPNSVPTNYLFSSAIDLMIGHVDFDTYDLSSDDKGYLLPKIEAETMPGQSDCTVCSLSAARLHFNSPHELSLNWGQINLNHNDYHSNPVKIGPTFWITIITDWWLQQEETDSKDSDFSNVACNEFSIIPHGVGVELSCSLWRDEIGCWQWRTTR